MEPSKMPKHPGSHFNVDIIRRANQKILVGADMFSSFITATLLTDERRQSLEAAIVQIITPTRNAPQISVRSDNAPAFKSLTLTPSSMLKENGILIILGDDGNKNSNSIVDKLIQELENEFKQLAPEGEKISEGRLGHAVTVLNSRIRSGGLSASEIHFSRDPNRDINLHLDDSTFAKDKTIKREMKNDYKLKHGKTTKESSIKPGDVVHIRHECSKHTARAPHLVTRVDGDTAETVKLLHTSQFQDKLPKLSQQRKIATKFLLPSTRISRTNLTTELVQSKTKVKEIPWIPKTNQDSDSDDYTDDDTSLRSEPECVSSNTSDPGPKLRDILSCDSNQTSAVIVDPLQSFNQSRNLKKVTESLFITTDCIDGL